MNNTTQLQAALDRWDADHDQARTVLIERASDRLQALASRMLDGFPKLRRWEMTDDVLQGALMRLHRALAEKKPESVLHFLRLAALQIRRELLDLVKRHAAGHGGHHHSDSGTGSHDSSGSALQQHAGPTDEPTSLIQWGAFHEAVQALPDEERAVVDLLWYQSLGQEEAATILGVNVRTIKRRWRSARTLLFQAMSGELPGG